MQLQSTVGFIVFHKPSLSTKSISHSVLQVIPMQQDCSPWCCRRAFHIVSQNGSHHVNQALHIPKRLSHTVPIRYLTYVELINHTVRNRACQKFRLDVLTFTLRPLEAPAKGRHLKWCSHSFEEERPTCEHPKWPPLASFIMTKTDGPARPARGLVGRVLWHLPLCLARLHGMRERALDSTVTCHQEY